MDLLKHPAQFNQNVSPHGQPDIAQTGQYPLSPF